MPLNTETSDLTFEYDPEGAQSLATRLFGDNPPKMKISAKCDHCGQLVNIGTVTSASKDGDSNISVKVEATDGEHRLWLAHVRGECRCTCIGTDEKPGCTHGQAAGE